MSDFIKMALESNHFFKVTILSHDDWIPVHSVFRFIEDLYYSRRPEKSPLCFTARETTITDKLSRSKSHFDNARVS